MLEINVIISFINFILKYKNKCLFTIFCTKCNLMGSFFVSKIMLESDRKEKLKSDKIKNVEQNLNNVSLLMIF